jgi:hypothetical protein
VSNSAQNVSSILILGSSDWKENTNKKPLSNLRLNITSIQQADLQQKTARRCYIYCFFPFMQAIHAR